jgi:hypothetical protein
MRSRELGIWLVTVVLGAGVAWGLLSRRATLVPREVALAAGAPSDPEWRTGTTAQVPPTEPAFEATETDWEIMQATVREARAAGLGELPMGEVVARVGLTFVGTPYEPGTLELPGAERLVVNLRELDCVTFVENALVLASLVKTVPDALVENRAALATAYRRRLAQLRYRGGVLDGYPSRLHYFSEWLSDNELKGIVKVVTSDLAGARRDTRSITFMSDHPEAYRQIAENPEFLEAVRSVESGLGAPRWYVPQEGIEAAAAGGGIRNGDVIAAKSILEGLDVAHTGIALWQDGELHLLHAPLVGDSVEVSPLPLGRRIRGIRAQDGILVARPLEPAEAQGRPGSGGPGGGG